MASADPDLVAEDVEAAPSKFAAVTAETPSGRVTAGFGVNIRTGPGTMYPDRRHCAAGIPRAKSSVAAPTASGGQRPLCAQWLAGWLLPMQMRPATPTPKAGVAPLLPETTAAIQGRRPGYEVPQGVILPASRRAGKATAPTNWRTFMPCWQRPAHCGRDGGQQRQRSSCLSPDRSMLASTASRATSWRMATTWRPAGACALRLPRTAWAALEPHGDRIVFASNWQGDLPLAHLHHAGCGQRERLAEMDYAELDFGKDPDWHPSDEPSSSGLRPAGQNCGLYTMARRRLQPHDLHQRRLRTPLRWFRMAAPVSRARIVTATGNSTALRWPTAASPRLTNDPVSLMACPR